MKSPSVAFIAKRFFIGNGSHGDRDQARKALTGAVLSIALSLVPLIAVMQVTDGMIEGITARYVELGTYHAQLLPYGKVDYDRAVELVRKCPDITGAFLETQSVAIVFANGAKEGSLVRGVEDNFFFDEGTKKYLSVEKGEAVLEKDNDIVIGIALAEKLNIEIGNTVNIITVRHKADGSLLPKIGIFTVKGIVSSGYRDLDAQWVFIKQKVAKKIFAKENTKMIIGLKTKDPFKNPEKIIEDVGNYIDDGFYASSWKDLEYNLYESLSSTRTMLLLIMAITVVVATVNVSSALTTLVLERSQEIAVLKSLGARPSDLQRIFSFGGCVIGALGAIFGSIGGLLASLEINNILSFIEKVANFFRSVFASITNISSIEEYHVLSPEYYLQTIPINISYFDILLVVATTIVLSFFVSFRPAKRASKLSPLDAMRKR